ncbi:MAG: DUF362 domain-containing protein [Blastocatellia bacterium]
MERRTFVKLLGATPLVASGDAPKWKTRRIPAHKAVTPYKPDGGALGMPGPYPGQVVSVKSETCLSADGLQINADAVREMMERGMRELTGQRQTIDAWRQFIRPDDVVGIKVNVVGHPWCVSSHAVVAETVRNLMAVGLRPEQIHIYDRFRDQLDDVNYRPHVPEGVNFYAAEHSNVGDSSSEYDPRVYLESDLFGEDNTRSSLMKLISRRVTKIISIPNMKDHGATGVTGCLKNIAYGGYSNVARTHFQGLSHTYWFVGKLASMEPVRSKTVLQIMDGLRGVWHAGPGARTLQYVFFPKTLMFGTDPVAIDRLLLDIIDDERKRRGVISIWDRDKGTLTFNNGRKRDADPNTNIIIREPGHVEYAGKLGLGVHQRSRIQVREIAV